MEVTWWSRKRLDNHCTIGTIGSVLEAQQLRTNVNKLYMKWKLQVVNQMKKRWEIPIKTMKL